MDTEKLTQLAQNFYAELQTSKALQDHRQDHQRRSERAQRLLTHEHIPVLTKDELQELYNDSDAARFWSKKEWPFNKRLQRVGLEGLQKILLELMTLAEKGLTAVNLQSIWKKPGLGVLFSTELLTYRFPDRYWTYSRNVTLPALQILGVDVWGTMPKGQKSDPYVYLALEPWMAEIRQALQAAGLSKVNNSMADIFLWWLKTANQVHRDVAVPPLSSTPFDLLATLTTALTAQGLYFTPWQIATFYTALQTKGFVILSGISGTGKTKLAQAFAELLPQAEGGTPPPSPDTIPNWLFVPVRPDWRDSKNLLGYYNPLLQSYEWTPFLRFLLRAIQNYEESPTKRLAWFVILDEMNLAHVEYYFADLLSVLESGRDSEGWTREPLHLPGPDNTGVDSPPVELRLPPNFYLIGTVNVDETTHAFSPKVLDRAFTLELTEVDFANYPPAAAPISLPKSLRAELLAHFSRQGRFAQLRKEDLATYIAAHPEVRDRLQRLNALLRPADLHFGYRVFDEIVAYLVAATDNGLYENSEEAMDAAVLMKILPKFHGSRAQLLEPLYDVLAWCLNPDTPDQATINQRRPNQTDSANGVARTKGLETLAFFYPRTARRVLRLLTALYTTGFAAFS